MPEDITIKIMNGRDIPPQYHAPKMTDRSNRI
jgi:hypothetical protein